MVPLFSRLSAKDDHGLSLVFWFVGVLFALRVVPAILRKALPFSRQVTVIWAERRRMAKRFDSYQWQKLFWFGIGLAAYAISPGEFGGIARALTVFCLVSGALGFLVQRWKTSMTDTLVVRRR